MADNAPAFKPTVTGEGERVILGALGTLPQRVASEIQPQLPKVVTSSIFQYCTLHGLPTLPSISLSALNATSGAHLPMTCTSVLVSDSAFRGPQTKRGLKEGSWWWQWPQGRKGICYVRVGPTTHNINHSDIGLNGILRHYLRLSSYLKAAISSSQTGEPFVKVAMGKFLNVIHKL